MAQNRKKGTCIVPKQGEKMYRVYTVVPRPKQEDYWLNIGAAFPHDDGKNLNCILQAHPSGEKIVLREYEPKDAQAAGETESTKGRRATLSASRQEPLIASGSSRQFDATALLYCNRRCLRCCAKARERWLHRSRPWRIPRTPPTQCTRRSCSVLMTW